MPKMSARFGSLSGVAFVALVIGSQLSSGGLPDSSASPAKVIDFYQAHRTGEQFGAVLTAMAVVVGLYFFGSLRSYLGRVTGGARVHSHLRRASRVHERHEHSHTEASCDAVLDRDRCRDDARIAPDVEFVKGETVRRVVRKRLQRGLDWRELGKLARTQGIGGEVVPEWTHGTVVAEPAFVP